MSDPTGSTQLPRHESRLDAMLDDGEQHVEEHGAVASPEPHAKRWIPLMLAAAVATAAVLGGPAWLAGGDEASPPAATPGGNGASSSGNNEAGRVTQVPVYYVGSTAVGPRLFREQHNVTGVTGDDLEAAVAEAVATAPLDPDYTRFTSDAGLEAKATRDGDQVTIDFSEEVARPDGMNKKQAAAALQALVWTAGAGSTPGPVLFTVDGSAAESVLGIDTSKPIEPRNADDVLAPVSISSPSQEDTVPSKFTVKGEAAAFEANVVWELKQGDVVVKSGFTTAKECCTLSPYSFTVKAPPGAYTLHVHDTDESDGEGVGTSADTKDVTVQ